MNPLSELLSTLRPYTLGTSTMSVVDFSRERLSHYQVLRQSRDWSSLEEACLQDLQRAAGYAESLIDGWREQRILAVNLRRSVDVLKDVLVETEKRRPTKDIASETDPYLEPIRDLLAKEPLLPKHYGEHIVSSADLLLHLECAALTNLVEAQLRHKSPAVDKPELAQKIAESFWHDPQPGDVSGRLFEYRRALTGLVKKVYIGIMADRRSVPDKLAKVMAWVRQHLVDVVRLQSAVSLLLKQSRSHKEPTASVVLSSLSTEIGKFLREMIASHLAAQIGMFDFYGIKVNRDAAETLFGGTAVNTPFDSGWSVGKRAGVDRITSLSVGVRVSVRGVLQKAEFDAENNGHFRGELHEFAGPAVVLIEAPSDLRSYGLVEGCHVRVSGFVRPGDPSHPDQRHIEIEELNIREFHGQNWKVAFQSLSAPYFSVWPANYHVAFEVIPLENFSLVESTAKGGSATVQAGCNTERDEMDKALRDLTSAQNDVAIAVLGVIVGGIAAILAGGTDIALEAVAVLALAAAINKLHNAQSDYHAASVAYYSCMGISIGGGGGPFDPGDPGDSFDSFDTFSMASVGSVGDSFGSLGDSMGESFG